MATSTPKFDPFNPSAYTAPELPQVQTPTPTAAMAPANTPPPQQPAIGPGKVGSAALIADQVMRGFASGLAQGQMARAQKLQKTSQALQSSYGLAAKNLTDVVQQYNVTPQQLGAIQQGKTPPPGADGKPLDDSAIKALQSASSAVQGSWGAWTQWQGQHIDPQKSDKKGGKGKKDQSQQQPQGNPLQNAIRKVGEAMRGNDPAAVSQAVYQFWVANGPPVYHSLDAQMAQAGQRGAQEKLQSTTTGNEQATQDAIAIRNKYAGVDPNTLKPEEQAQLKSAEVTLTPPERASTASWKQYKLPSGSLNWYDVSHPETIPQGATAIPVGTAAQSKPLKYDAPTDQIIDPATNTRYSPNGQNLPPDVKAAFDGVKRAKENKETVTDHTSTYFFNDEQGNRHEVQVTTEGFHGPAGLPKQPAGGSPTTPGETSKHTDKIVGNVGSTAYKQLTKQATDAQKEFNSASTNLSTMLKTAKAAKGGDGSAQMGIVSSFLKTVVGGQGTGVRITKPEWDAVTKTRPWMQGIQATFSPAGMMTGAAIAPQQVDQMVKEVYAKTKSLYENVQATKEHAEDQEKVDVNKGETANPSPATSPQTHVFDSAAWKAANQDGDVEAAKAAAKAQGYEVR